MRENSSLMSNQSGWTGGNDKQLHGLLEKTFSADDTDDVAPKQRQSSTDGRERLLYNASFKPNYELPNRTKHQESNLLRAMMLELPPVYPQHGDAINLTFTDFKMYLEKLSVFLGRGTSTFGMNSGFRKASSFKLQCRLKDKCSFLIHSKELRYGKQMICECRPHSCSPDDHKAYSIVTQGFLSKYLFREEDFPQTISIEGREVQKFVACVSDKFGIDFRARGRREMVSRILHEKLGAPKHSLSMESLTLAAINHQDQDDDKNEHASQPATFAVRPLGCPPPLPTNAMPHLAATHNQCQHLHHKLVP